MITDCLSTNTALPLEIDSYCLDGYRAKMIESLRNNTIGTGYSRPVEGPTPDPGTIEVVITEVMENLLEQVVVSHTRQSIINVVPRDIFVMCSPLEMLHLKQHSKTLDSRKRDYTCDYCTQWGHTQGDCPVLLSGNQIVKPAKELIGGEYPVYATTEITNERMEKYPTCKLNERPVELYPDSALPVSMVEHSLHESITTIEIKEEKTTWEPPVAPPKKNSSCVLNQTLRAIQEETNSELATKYNATDDNYTATLQQNIDSSANCSVQRCRRESVYTIFDRLYKEVYGPTEESNHTFMHSGRIGHLDVEALSQSNQKPIRQSDHTIDSKGYVQQLKLTSKPVLSSGPDPGCIVLSGRNQLISYLMTYLHKEPGLKRSLPLFRLTPNTFGNIEKLRLISYQNIPVRFTITLESLRSLITSNGANVSFFLMENYYGLLREKFPPAKSDVMISSLKVVQCIYSVSKSLEAIPDSEQSCTKEILQPMLEESRVPLIQKSLRSKKIMIFPLYYHQDKQFLLAIVQRGIPIIHFFDTQHDNKREQFFSVLFPLFLSSYLDTKTEWESTWVHRQRPVQEINDSAIFVCVYMYLVMELTQREFTWECILSRILTIRQSTLFDNNIRSNIALSLLQKDLQYLATSFANCDIPSTSVSSINKHAKWRKSVRRGKKRSNDRLGLKKDDLLSPTSPVVAENLIKINNSISIGTDNSKQRQNDRGLLRQENDTLNYLSSLLTSDELTGGSLINSEVLSETSFLFKKRIISMDVLKQMELAQNLLNTDNIDDQAIGHTKARTNDLPKAPAIDLDNDNDHNNEHDNNHDNDRAPASSPAKVGADCPSHGPAKVHVGDPAKVHAAPANGPAKVTKSDQVQENDQSTVHIETTTDVPTMAKTNGLPKAQANDLDNDNDHINDHDNDHDNDRAPGSNQAKVGADCPFHDTAKVHVSDLAKVHVAPTNGPAKVRESDQVKENDQATVGNEATTDVPTMDQADLINFTSTFIMRNVNSKSQLFFTLDCNSYEQWLEQLVSTKLNRDNHSRIQKWFPWSYHKKQLLTTKCICIPLRQGDYHSVIFVMNVKNSMTKDTTNRDSDGIFEDDKDPVIYHFDCSPPNDTPEVDNPPVEFVYSFLNWLGVQKKSGKTETNFNSQNLPICVIHLKQPIVPWISGYNVIKYICVMYNQVVNNGYDGDGKDPNDMSSLIVKICNDDVITGTILSDLIQLFWSLYKTSCANSKLSKKDKENDNYTDTDSDSDETDDDNSYDDDTNNILHKTTTISTKYGKEHQEFTEIVRQCQQITTKENKTLKVIISDPKIQEDVKDGVYEVGREKFDVMHKAQKDRNTVQTKGQKRIIEAIDSAETATSSNDHDTITISTDQDTVSAATTQDKPISQHKPAITVDRELVDRKSIKKI